MQRGGFRIVSRALGDDLMDGPLACTAFQRFALDRLDVRDGADLGDTHFFFSGTG